MLTIEFFKVWPTRRIHAFIEGEDVSICCLTWRVAGDKVHQSNGAKRALKVHPYDDLNYCQSCRRSLMKMAGQKYEPLTSKYEHLRKAYEARKNK